MGGLRRSSQLRDWATRELEGYPRRDSVPAYRVVSAPMVWDVAVPFRGVTKQPVNVWELPDFVREHINETVHLNQAIDELEALAAESEERSQPIRLGVIGGDLYLDLWNRNNRSGQQGLQMYYVIDPAVIRGVLGRVRTTLTQFVAELRSEVVMPGSCHRPLRPTRPLQAAVPWAVISDSNVTIMTTKEGDIMPKAPRTTIKNNKTKIRGSTGNVSVASAHIAQVNVDGIDLDKVRDFADLVTQIAPTFGWTRSSRPISNALPTNCGQRQMTRRPSGGGSAAASAG